jgi:hypothetical protein
VQDSVELPDPVTLFGVSVQLSPVAGLMVEVRLITPLKFWSAVTVIAEVAGVPAFIATEVGLAAIVKSWTMKVAVAE